MRSKLSLLGVTSIFAVALTIPALSQEGKKEEGVAAAVKLAEITIGGEISEGVEGPGGLSLFGGGQPKLLSAVIQTIEKARKDSEVQGLLLKVDGPQLGMAKLSALRRALKEFKAAGKKIHVHFSEASTKEYLLAAGADDISMTPTGFLLLPGLRIEMTYMKDLFDWAGIKADVIHIGEFKTAYENYYRNEMSEGQKEAYGAILDGFYSQIVSAISEGRKMTEERVKAAIDYGFFAAAQARGRGLIDFLEYEDEFYSRLKTAYGSKLEILENYGKKEKLDLDLTDFTAIFSIISEMTKKPSSPKGDRIAVVYAVGMINTGKSQNSPFGGQVMGSETMVKAIREAAEDKSVKAIVLRVDSPGGSGLASDEIWREVIRAKEKKPFIVSMSDVAGSGGYYIAMAADSIVAEEGTITGSIGVIGMKMVTGGLYQKIGLHTQSLQRGKNAGLFSSSSVYSDEERALMTRILESFYQNFVSKVAEGRHRSFEEIDKIARGRIWTGKQAKEIGLVDELGSLDTAIALAKKKAGIDAGKELPVLEFPRPKSLMEMLEDGFPFGVKLDAAFTSELTGSLLALPELQHAYRVLDGLRRIQDHSLCLMPVDLSWN